MEMCFVYTDKIGRGEPLPTPTYADRRSSSSASNRRGLFLSSILLSWSLCLFTTIPATLHVLLKYNYIIAFESCTKSASSSSQLSSYELYVYPGVAGPPQTIDLELDPRLCTKDHTQRKGTRSTCAPSSHSHPSFLSLEFVTSFYDLFPLFSSAAC